MAFETIVGEVVGEEDVKLCPDVIVTHLMQKVHGFGSSAVSGGRAYIREEKEKKGRAKEGLRLSPRMKT